MDFEGVELREVRKGVRNRHDLILADRDQLQMLEMPHLRGRDTRYTHFNIVRKGVEAPLKIQNAKIEGFVELRKVGEGVRDRHDLILAHRDQLEILEMPHL